MEAVHFTLSENKLELVEKPKPKLSSPYDVIIKIAFSGICGKDILILDGKIPCSSTAFTPGHQLCGIVTDHGELVTVVEKGDRVVIDPISGCGLCDYCKQGAPQYCDNESEDKSIGTFRNGAWADYILVDETQVYIIPTTVTLEQAVLAYPLVCISHGLEMLMPTVGQSILIVGSGLMGDLWIALLHCQGHRNITISEPNLARLEYAQKLGAPDKELPHVLISFDMSSLAWSATCHLLPPKDDNSNTKNNIYYNKNKSSYSI